jgi:hypothetical protein
MIAAFLDRTIKIKSLLARRKVATAIDDALVAHEAFFIVAVKFEFHIRSFLSQLIQLSLISPQK